MDYSLIDFQLSLRILVRKKKKEELLMALVVFMKIRFHGTYKYITNMGQADKIEVASIHCHFHCAVVCGKARLSDPQVSR